MTIISHKHKFIFVRPRKTAGSSVLAALAPLCGEDDVIAHGDSGFDANVDQDEYQLRPPQHADWRGRYGYVSPHALPEVIRAKIGTAVWNEYFKFTIARNPWDLFISYFHYHLLIAMPRRDPEWNAYLRENLRRPAPAQMARLWRGAWRLATGRALLPEKMCNYLRLAPQRFWRPWLVRLHQAGHRQAAVSLALRTRAFTRDVREIPAFYFCGGRCYADHVIRFENLQSDFGECCERLRLSAGPLLRIKSQVRSDESDYRGDYTAYARQRIAAECLPMIDLFGYRFDEPA